MKSIAALTALKTKLRILRVRMECKGVGVQKRRSRHSATALLARSGVLSLSATSSGVQQSGPHSNPIRDIEGFRPDFIVFSCAKAHSHTTINITIDIDIDS
ncbi:hypothetical protein CVT25_008886 [Psilocybe cyanescens]|uniref:Uncharacterized protein n=1 Tax=Psilocybe cyanescens TaxID=93625 RepID=A0A409VRH5_PSICY|nr:hypothetical protein CVT25_008886 [Psilocybe cyanescens]